MRRVALACCLFLALLGLPLAGEPGRTASLPAPAPFDPERILGTCLQPPPAGYVASPQKHQRQRTPLPLAPAARSRLLFPYFPHLMGRTMGWTLPDDQYTAAIPAEAKQLPADPSSLPVLRFNNLEIHGERELRWCSNGPYDQWLLHDATRKLDAVMAIHRETRRVYFFEYRWRGGQPVFDQSTESCYSCHASGPRLVRTYSLEKVNRTRLDEFNRRLLSYGAADFGDSIDPQRLGPTVDDGRCTGCHDGRTRGRLYAIHLPTIAYYLQTLRVMPPGSPLRSEDAGSLIRSHYQRYEAAFVGR